MDFSNVLKSDKHKKSMLKAILSETKVNKIDLKKFLLENFKIIPQEDRSIVWKILLGKFFVFFFFVLNHFYKILLRYSN